MSNRKQVQFISYLALYTAMYVVLKYVGNLIPFLAMPNGGSIELELIAVCLASYHLKWKGGAAVALLSWLITIVLGFPMYFVHPVQIALDYVLPLLAIGLSALHLHYLELSSKSQGVISAARAVFLFAGILLSFGYSAVTLIAALVLSAATFFISYYYIKRKRFFGIIPAFFAKYLFTVISGAYFWAEGAAAGSREAWAFSLSYNLGYNLVSMIVCTIVVPLLWDRIRLVTKVQTEKKD